METPEDSAHHNTSRATLSTSQPAGRQTHGANQHTAHPMTPSQQRRKDRRQRQRAVEELISRYPLTPEEAEKIRKASIQATEDMHIYGRAVMHTTPKGIENLHPLTEIPKISETK